MTDDNHKDLSRRDFIKATTAFVGGFIGITIGLPAIAYLLSPSLRKNEEAAWINLGALADYPLGIPKLFQFTRTSVNGWERTGMSYGVFVMRQDEKNVRVFSNICTHLGCHVNWHSDVQHYISPCHDGHFDILGKNISGPPPRPLDEFITKIEEGNLFIQLPAFRRTS
ncbi:MAG: ubiquinol-cytochrome c reductase iron-sulfur subunit [Chloroflexi bacterium]|nr:ubiquinol-cytochrome c reductase iron-sulfur subunit [Chloroflexota bacterium]